MQGMENLLNAQMSLNLASQAGRIGNAADESDEAAASDENESAGMSANGQIDISVGDTVNGSTTANVSAPSQNSVNIAL